MDAAASVIAAAELSDACAQELGRSSSLFLCQIAIDSGCRLAPLGYGPYNQRLIATHIARGKDAVDGGHVIRGSNISARIECYTQLLNHAVADWAKEAHRQQDKIDIEGELGAGDCLELRRWANTGCV